MYDLQLYTQALYHLRPGKPFIVQSDENDPNKLIVKWLEEGIIPPTDDEIKTVIDSIKGYFEARRQRQDNYPLITEQLDMLYHLGYDGWREKIKEIKDKFPVPQASQKPLEK